jgi:hypothetical protein
MLSMVAGFGMWDTCVGIEYYCMPSDSFAVRCSGVANGVLVC